MRYDKYLKHIQRLNKALNIVYRLRFVLISVTSLTLASVMTFEFTKGIVKLDAFNVLTYTYGDSVTASSSAFANDSSVEYKEESATEWVSEAPIYPGNYEVRGVSKNGFGAKTTSDPIKFTILPKTVEVSISNSQIVYGDLPKVSASLFGSDAISSYNVKYENEFEFTTKAQVDKDSVVIVDKEGKDITFCYNIVPKEKELSILTRPISVTFKNNSKVYDAKDIEEFDGEITKGTLAGGDAIEFIENETHYSAAGSYEYEKGIVIKRGDTDVTKMYSISTTKGSLNINKIAINAYSDSYDGIYNGKSLLENNALNITVESEKLVEGHKANVEFDENVLSFENSTEVINNLSATFAINIVDAEGNDVTASYDITKSYGDINVSKRDVEIVFGSAEKLYDGKVLSNTKYTWSEDLVSTDTVQINEDLFPSITTPDTVENFVELANINIINKDALDVTHCYNISFVPGSLVINKPSLYFDMPTFGDITYDGKLHTLDNFKLVEELSDDISKDFTFKLTGDIRTYKNVGLYDDNELDDFQRNKIDVYLGEEIVTQFFNIEYNYNSSSISQREINPTFYIIKDEKQVNKITYDSYTHDVGVKFNENELVEEVDKPIINCEPLFDSGDYSIDNFGFDIVDIESEESTLDNYKINESNTITIDKKEVEVKLPNAKEVYCGDYYDFKVNEEELDNTICDNDSYYAESLHEINVGKYNYDSSMFTCDHYDNYIFKFTPSENTVNEITKRPITISFSDYTTTYDGKSHYIPFEITNGTLVEGHSIVGAEIIDGELTSKTLKVKNAITYHKSNFEGFFNNDGSLAIDIIDANGNIVTDNYEISENFDDVDIEIQPLKIGVKFFADGDYGYCGEDYTFDDYKIMDPKFEAEKALAEGEEATLINAFVAKRAGEYTNDNKATIQIKGLDELGNKISTTGNYEITYDRWEKVNIDKARLDIMVKGFETTYDGNDFKTHFEAQENLVSYKVNGEEQEMFEGTKLQVSYKTNDTILFVNNQSLQNYLNVTLINDKYKDPESDYFNNNETNMFEIGSITFGTCNYSKYDITFTGKTGSQTYNGKTPSNLNVVYSEKDYGEFMKLHTLKKDDNAITTDALDYSKNAYDLKVDKEKFHFYRKINDVEYDVTNYINLNFDDLSKKIKIGKRSLTINEKGDEFFEGEKEKANEQFDKITGLIEGEKLFLVNDDGIEEEVTTTKTEYDLIANMTLASNSGGIAGTAFRYINKESEKQLIMESQFRVKAFRNNAWVDVTKNYNIKITKDDVRFGNPIYIKKGETLWKSTDVQNVKPNSKES